MRIIPFLLIFLIFGCNDEMPIDTRSDECVTGHINNREIDGSCFSKGEQKQNSFRFLFSGSFSDDADAGFWATAIIDNSSLGTHEIEPNLSSILMDLGGCNPLWLRGTININEKTTDRIKGNFDLDMFCNEDKYDGYFEFDVILE